MNGCLKRISTKRYLNNVEIASQSIQSGEISKRPEFVRYDFHV